MSIKIIPFTLGPLENKTYIIFSNADNQAALIDPSFNIDHVIKYVIQNNLDVDSILITHAHFDHVAGVSTLMECMKIRPKLALHPADLSLWKNRGDARHYGYQLDPMPDPDHFFVDGEIFTIDDFHFVIHHTPGHSPGHVVLSLPQEKTIFTGDVIFAGGIGRTDINGGDYLALIRSIQNTIMTQPDEIRLFPGHGPETTVGHERTHNPFL